MRHYGQDASGKRTTINYFSTRASAGAGASTGPGQAARETDGAGAGAEASTTTVRTVITGSADGSDAGDPAAVLGGFEGLELDPQAHAAIAAALEACAARARENDAAMAAGGDAALLAAADDPDASFVAVAEGDNPCLGELEPLCDVEAVDGFIPNEPQWRMAGADKPAELVAFEEELAARREGRARPSA